ncbi:MAG: hypothetical protein ACRES3_05595 [Steroidobacteraceae bacterium]
MKSYLALIITIAAMPALSGEPTPWSQAERDAAITGCARAIAKPAYIDYRKRHNLSEPDPETLEKAIEFAIATNGPVWAMCACVMDEVAKRWEASALLTHQDDVNALAIELANNGKCKPAT